jgi:hypothetical protein
MSEVLTQGNVIVEEDEELIDINEEEKEVEEEEQDTTEEEAKPKEENIPEKFQGKTLAEVVKSYENLEREFGRKSNEVGQLRKLTDQLLDLERPKEEKKEVKKIDPDALIENPDEVLNEAISNNPTLKSIEERLVSRDRETAQAAFETAHPDWKEVMGSDEFAQYIKASPVRERMLIEADQNFDYQTGASLLEDFKRLYPSNTAADEGGASGEEEVEEVGKKITTESKSKSRSTGKKIYRRQQLIDLRVNNPEEYERRQDEFRKAYEEGRVR